MRLRYVVLILSVGLMLSGVLIGSAVQSGFGTVAVTEEVFQADDGSNIYGTLQMPTYATSSDPLPGVVVIHGSLQSKEWLMAFGIELSRRGFVVLTIDANGHGNSDPGSGSGSAALEFLADLDYVDETQLGLIGHSMGGGISWSALDGTSLTVNAIALVGSWVREAANETYPNNVLVAVGEYDELIYPVNRTALEPSFGVSPVVEGVTYGDFANGTARRLIISRTNHLFCTIDGLIVSETVEWMKNSLKGEIADSHWVDAADQVYTLWLVGGFISVFGIVVTIFPLLAILLDVDIFASLKQDPSMEYEASTKSYLGNGLIYALIGVGGFFPFLGIGMFLPSPQYRATSVLTWILGSALLAALALFLIVKRKKDPSLDWKRLWGIGEPSTFFPKFVKSLVLSLIVFIWLYGWTLIVDQGFVLEFRAFLPGFNDLTVARAVLAPFYMVIFMIYFLVEGMWLMGVMRTRVEGSMTRQITVSSVLSVFIKCIPYVILVTLQLGIGALTGVPMAQGLIGYSFLFFFAFTPWFAVGAVVIAFCYRYTDNYWLGAILNGIMFGWLLASILAF